MRQPEIPDRPTASESAAVLQSEGDASRRAPGLGPWLAEMRPRLFRLAYRMLWNSHDAEEIAQDCLTTALGRIGRLRNPGKRNTWLYRVAINLSKRRLRGRRRHTVRIEPSIDAPFHHDGHRIEQSELAARVRQAMADLPARQRKHSFFEIWSSWSTRRSPRFWPRGPRPPASWFIADANVCGGSCWRDGRNRLRT